MRINLSKFAGIGLLLILFGGAFASKFLNAYQLLLSLLVIGVFLRLICNSSFPLQISRPEIRSIVIFILIICITCFFSTDRISSFKYLFLWVSILLIVQIALYDRESKSKIYNIFVCFCFIECFFILLQRIAPSVVDGLNSILLSSYVEDLAPPLDLHDAYTGIAANQPHAMFFSFCVFCIGIIRAQKKVSVINIGTAVLGMACMLLSGKRSAIAIVAITLLYMRVVVYKRIAVFSLQWRLLLVVICGVGLYLLFFTELGINLISKNESLISTGDISNGRLYLISEMMRIFKEHPIVGLGPLATYSYAGMYLGHNIYVQALEEMGLIGFCGLTYMLLLNLRRKTQVIREGAREDADYFCVYVQLFFIIYGFFGNPLFSYMFLIPYILFSTL